MRDSKIPPQNHNNPNKQTKEMKIHIHIKTYINLLEAAFIKTTKNGAGDGSAVGSTSCPMRGLEFRFQNLNHDSQKPIIPTPGHLMPFSDHHGHLHTHMYTYKHVKKIILKIKITPPKHSDMFVYNQSTWVANKIIL